MSSEKPLILIADPSPRTIPMVFNDNEWARISSLGRVVVHDKQSRLSDAALEGALQEATVIVGQINLPKERLAQCRNLKAIFNIEGNFLPNIDYGYCFGHGIRVLNISPVFAAPVAEMALGMAISSIRSIVKTDRAFRSNSEIWGPQSAQDDFTLYGGSVGIIGLGDIGSTLRKLLAPFRCKVHAYDPWIPDSVLRELDCIPTSLDSLMENSRVIFILAGATEGNAGFIDKSVLEKVKPNSSVLLLSRAAIIDFEAFTSMSASGRFKGGADVFPDEPLERNHLVRTNENLIFSSHRAGGPIEFYKDIGRMVNDDLELILQGLPPRVCKRAEPETVMKMRGKPLAEDI